MSRSRGARSRASSRGVKDGGRPAPKGLRELRVHPREAGLRVDRFLSEALPGLSRKRAKRLVDERRVWVDGRIEPMASRLLEGGECLHVDVQERPKQLTPELSVLHEDAHCVVVNKPPGIPSGPTRDPKRAHAAQLAEKLAGCPLTLLHRLDKDTSGVLLLGKTRSFSGTVFEAFRRREVEKVYLALVRGYPRSAFEVVSHLREGEGDRILTVRSGGVRAETRFRVLVAEGEYALVEATPRTGRTHQIRVHLAQVGHPILGDSLYGGDGAAAGQPVPRQMLHAARLTFPHPGQGRPLTVECPVPADFLAVAGTALGRSASRHLKAAPRGHPA